MIRLLLFSPLRLDHVFWNSGGGAVGPHHVPESTLAWSLHHHWSEILQEAYKDPICGLLQTKWTKPHE